MTMLVACLPVGAGAHAQSTVTPEPRADGTRVFSPPEEARARPKKPTITYWTVTVSMEVEPTAEPASVRMLVPISDGRQAILGRTVRPSAFRFREDAEPPTCRVEPPPAASATSAGPV